MPSNSDIFYARIRPYNPQKGCVVKRTVKFGREWVGGDGLFEIPPWYKVTRKTALKLMALRQISYKPESPRLFDIVTPEVRARVDVLEEQRRRGVLGGKSISSLPNVQAAVRDTTSIDAQEASLDRLARGAELLPRQVEQRTTEIRRVDDLEDKAVRGPARGPRRIKEGEVVDIDDEGPSKAEAPIELKARGRAAAMKGLGQDVLDYSDPIEQDELEDWGDVEDLNADLRGRPLPENVPDPAAEEDDD